MIAVGYKLIMFRVPIPATCYSMPPGKIFVGLGASGALIVNDWISLQNTVLILLLISKLRRTTSK